MRVGAWVKHVRYRHVRHLRPNTTFSSAMPMTTQARFVDETRWLVEQYEKDFRITLKEQVRRGPKIWRDPDIELNDKQKFCCGWRSL
jgi:hypothetical protein